MVQDCFVVLWDQGVMVQGFVGAPFDPGAMARAFVGVL